MAKKITATKPESEVKRPVGRPPAMPGEKMENHMVRVAIDVPTLIGELAAARGQSRGEVVTILVRQAAAARTRRAAKKTPVAVTVPEDANAS